MSTYIYDGNVYQTRSPLNGLEGYIAATAVSGAILSPLAYIGKLPVRQIKKEEQYNPIYKDCLYKALHKSGLYDMGVDIIKAQNADISHEYKSGRNAAYLIPDKKVIINTNKSACLGFHELGHAMNNLMSKYGIKYLTKMRYPGYVIAGIMEYFAIFSRTKPKEAQRNIMDIIEDNCGKIAFLAMMPMVAEEAIASIRGMKLAEEAGLPKELRQNMKKLLSKALMTYGGKAVLGGLAVYASRKIMDYFTRPKNIGNFDLFS